MKWLEQAALQAAAAESTSHNDTVPVQVKQVEQMIKVVQRKVPEAGTDAVDWGFDPHHHPSKSFQLGIVPPKNPDITKQITALDQRNLQALCRGIDILPPKTRKNLMCFYAYQGLGGNKWVNLPPLPNKPELTKLSYFQVHQ